jgi:hypothetical protein
MKKLTYYITILMVSFTLYSKAQQQTATSLPAFETFFKNKAQIFPGVFPIYQVEDKYYLEIEEAQFNKDILIIGDLKNGTSTLAKTTGIIQFSKGLKNNLNVSRNNYSERAVDNELMAAVVSKSTLPPVSFVYKIEAMGNKKGSYIIDITRQLIDGGDLFSFKNYGPISTPDAARSNVETVLPIADGVVFNVIRTQTNPGRTASGKTIDLPSSFQLDLVIQQLTDQLMPVKFSDKRVGFVTQSYTDFGKAEYAAKKINIIKKWNISANPTDLKQYKKGILVSPQTPIKVYLDPAIPKVFANAVKDGITSWNACFETAGFKNVLRIIPASEKSKNAIASGTLVVSWGENLTKASIAIIDDPRTGEIKAAKMSISSNLASDLLAKYFVQCGAYDERIQQDLYHLEVQKELIKFKVSQAMAEVLGMLPNLAASTAYSPEQISDPKWVMQHGFTTSITDNSEFNFLMNPKNQKDEKLFIPSIGAYDHFAINWAYRQNMDGKTVNTFLNKGRIDSNYFYAVEDKKNVLTQANDLSNDLLKSAELGIAKLPVFYPKLEEIALKMKDDSWDTYMLVASNFITTYDQYVSSVLPNIGGRQSRVVIKNYNEVPFVFVPKATQQQTFDFLNTYVLQGVPQWTTNNRAQSLDGSNTERLILKTATKVVNTLTSAETLTDLLAAEESGQQNVFGTAELFENMNRYIFKNFDPAITTTRYTRSIQSKTVKNIIDLAAKNKLAAGLNELTSVVNSYITFLQDKIDLMGKTHTDPITKAHYQLLKIQLKNEYLTK